MMMASDEKEEMFDDWEDEGFPSDDEGFPEEADAGGFEEAVPQQKAAKKKGGGGIFLFLLILLGGAGGGFYYLTTPAGAPYRDYLPEAVRGYLPADEAPKPKVAATPKDVADILDGDIDSSATQDTANNIDPLGFQAPPMPSLSDAADTTSADDATSDTENTESFATFGDTAKDETADDAVEVAAWGSETPAEDNATALSFDSADDTEAAAVDETPAVLTTDTADEKPEAVTDVADETANDASSLVATTNQMPAVKTEQLIDLEDRMSVLEKAVHGLEKTVVTKKDLAGLQSNVSSLQADIKALRSELKKTASVARGAASAPKTAAPSFAADTTAAKPVKTVKTAPKREWVMVSAQPGTAWISEKGSSSKREISVGDTVPGLGRITSIAPSAGSGLWIVKGTQGTLQQ